jgi:hypothetical protein
MTNLIEALESGDYRTLLVAMRDKLAETIDEGVSPRDLASLSRRLIDLADEVRNLDRIGTDENNLPMRVRTLRRVQDEAFDPAAV